MLATSKHNRECDHLEALLTAPACRAVVMRYQDGRWFVVVIDHQHRVYRSAERSFICALEAAIETFERNQTDERDSSRSEGADAVWTRFW